MDTMACTQQHWASSPHRLVMFVVLALLVLHPPTSNAQGIAYSIQEEHEPVLLGDIARDAGIDDKPDLQFSIISKVNYKQDLFELDTSSGIFRTSVRLDRESLCGSVPKCVMTTLVAAASSTDDDYFTRFTVNVTVQDANDQGPEFKEESFSISISERSPVNSTFQLPVASDADVEPAFGVKGYRLSPASSQTQFDLVQSLQTPGRQSIHLRLRQSLDRELHSSHSLTLVAFDGGNPPNEAQLSIEITVLDANDNAPKFSTENDEYRLSVTETHPIHTPIHTLRATDRDAEENARVGYEFPIDVSPRIREMFEIEKTTGVITLIKSLDKEGGNTISFKVSAFDYGSPSKSSEVEVIVTILDTVNDPPTIRLSPWKNENGRAVVSESAPVGTKVAFVDVDDTDSDNEDITCGVESDFFNMQPYKTQGVYTISVAERLDREASAEHTVIIRCSDRGNPPMTSTEALSVKVEDSNDNLPVFTRDVYRMTVKENQVAGKRLGAISASDIDVGRNGEIRYSIDSNIVQFEIEEVSGVIKTAVENLDRELTSSYTFDVYATDTGPDPLTATATVVVIIEDMNDEWPTFDKPWYQFNVSEKTDMNRIIGVVHASDKDLLASGTVKYLMVHSPLNPNPPFAVNRQDGSIVLTEQLDFEKKKSYSFVVTAVDLGRPPRNSSVKIDIEIVDENDNSPVIEFPSPENLSVTLSLDVTPGHEVVKVSAYDRDSGENGRLSFSILGPNTTSSNLFWINEDTGLVTLLSPLTDNDVRSYNVIISVRDNGIQQRATQAILKVDIVRNADPTSSSQTNMTIVIIMVCVTLFVAVIVLATLCFIKYIDKRNFYAHNNKDTTTTKNDSSKKGKSSTTYSDASSGRRGEGDIFFDTVLENSPSLQQKQPLSSTNSSSSRHHNNNPQGTQGTHGTQGTIMNPHTSTLSAITLKQHGKKCVTFDDDDMASRSGNGSMTSDTSNHHNDSSLFLESGGGGGGVSTFKPGSCPALYNIKPPNPLHHHHHHHQQQQQHHHQQFPHPHNPPPSVNFAPTADSSSLQQLLDNSNASSSRTVSPHPLQPQTLPQAGSTKELQQLQQLQQQQHQLQQQQRLVDQGSDEMIDFALHNHHALVRSMRGRRPAGTGRQAAARAPSATRDTTDICSSSSVETSDSGHGSELDVSVVKATV